MTPAKEVRQQFTAMVKDRLITVNAPTDGQLAQLSRSVGVAQRAKEGDVGTMVTAIARMLDVMLAIIANDDDREFLDEGMVQGEIGLSDMQAIMQAISQDRTTAPRNGPVKSAARGRR